MSGRVRLIETAPSSVLPPADVGGDTMGDVDPQFSLFVSRGFVSLTGEETDRVPVTILRDIILSCWSLCCPYRSSHHVARTYWCGGLK